MVRRLSRLIVLFVLLSVSCFAYPLTPDFSAYTQSSKYDTCSCRPIEYNITVFNTGSFVAGYAIRQEGKLASYSIVKPEGFVLEPGKSQVVSVLVNVPCNIRGDSVLTTKIRNDMNVEKIFKQTFSVKQCSSIDFKLDKAADEACRCSEFKYDFIVHNPGVYSEDYYFTLPKDVEGSVSQASATIKAGESSKFTATIVPPCEWESRSVELTIKTKYTAQSKSFDLPLKVKADCAVKEYTPKTFNYVLWLVCGLGGILLILLILLIIIIIRRLKKRQPKLVQLRLAKEPKVEIKPLEIKPAKPRRKFPKLPWKRIIIILLIIAFWVGVGFAAYKFLPPLFAGEEHIPIAPRPPMFAINNTGQPPVVEDKFNFNPVDSWVYILVVGAVLLAAVIVFSIALKCRVCRAVKWLRRILLVIFILYGLGFGAYFIYYFWDVIWPPVKEFVLLYYVYALIGLAILAVIIVLAWVASKRRNAPKKEIPKEEKWDSEDHICEFCGRAFKSEAGLKRHQSTQH